MRDRTRLLCRLLCLMILLSHVKLLAASQHISFRPANSSLEEGSGAQDEGSGEEFSGEAPLSSLVEQLDDGPSASLLSSTHSNLDYGIDKRAVDRTATRIGQLPTKFFVPFSLAGSNLPSDGTLAMNRPLLRNRVKKDEYVAYFIEWVQASEADPLSIVVQTNTKGAYRKATAGVYIDGNYEFLGEANMDENRFYYPYNGVVHVIEGQQFFNKVFVLTKKQCSCSCSGKSFFSSVSDFFG